MVSRKSFKYWLQSIPRPKDREYMARLYQSIMKHREPIEPIQGEKVALKDAYAYLGRSIISMELLDKYVKRLNDLAGRSSSLILWPIELHELRGHLAKEAGICRELIGSVVYHEAKEQKEKEHAETK